MTLAETDPYPWPFDGELDASKLALVVGGAQRHFASVSARSAEVLVLVEHLSAAVRAAGGRVILIRHGITRSTHDPRVGTRPIWLPFRGTHEWELTIAPSDNDIVVDAAGFDGFYGSSLDLDLGNDGRSHLLLGGLASEITVDGTMRTANDLGYECLVLADACAPLDTSTGEKALSSVTMSGGIFGAVGTAREVMELLNREDRYDD